LSSFFGSSGSWGVGISEGFLELGFSSPLSSGSSEGRVGGAL